MSCLFHRWGKWSGPWQIERTIASTDREGVVVAPQLVQFRDCRECYMRQVRVVCEGREVKS